MGITLPDLVRALDCGFAEVGNDRWLRVFAHPGPRPEFLVCDMRHNISFHSFRYEDETTADQVRAEQGQQLRFFHRKFMEVLETGERLFVFQRPKQILAEQMLPLLNQLRSYGPNALLYVTEGRRAPARLGRTGGVWALSWAHERGCAGGGCGSRRSACLAQHLCERDAALARSDGHPMIEDEVYAIIRDVLLNDDLVLTPETSAADVEGWDSVQQVSIILAVEAHFGIRLKSREIDRLRNVGDIVRVIGEKK